MHILAGTIVLRFAYNTNNMNTLEKFFLGEGVHFAGWARLRKHVLVACGQRGLSYVGAGVSEGENDVFPFTLSSSRGNSREMASSPDSLRGHSSRSPPPLFSRRDDMCGSCFKATL